MTATDLSGRDRPGIPSVIFVILSGGRAARRPRRRHPADLRPDRQHGAALGLCGSWAYCCCCLASATSRCRDTSLTPGRSTPTSPKASAAHSDWAQRGSRWSRTARCTSACTAWSVRPRMCSWIGRSGCMSSWWIVALVALVLVTGNGLVRIRLRGRILALLVCLELVAVMGFVVVAAESWAGRGLQRVHDGPEPDARGRFRRGVGAVAVCLCRIRNGDRVRRDQPRPAPHRRRRNLPIGVCRRRNRCGRSLGPGHCRRCQRGRRRVGHDGRTRAAVSARRWLVAGGRRDRGLGAARHRPCWPR